MFHDYESEISFFGNKDEINSFINAIQRFDSDYQVKTSLIFNSLCTPECAEPDELKIEITFARQYQIDDFRRFYLELAEAVPHARFDGDTLVRSDTGWMKLHATLNDDRLVLDYTVRMFAAAAEKYHQYFREKLPYEAFVKAFGLSGPYADKQSYEEMLHYLTDEDPRAVFTDLTHVWFDVAYKMVDISVYQYYETMESLKSLGILSYEDFFENLDDENRNDGKEELLYHPESGEFVPANQTQPPFSADAVADIIRQNLFGLRESYRKLLQVSGKEYDDKALFSLKTDEANRLIQQILQKYADVELDEDLELLLGEGLRKALYLAEHYGHF